ncbi:arsenic resistance protein [Nesterenkonia xinjiangensis]|uniref:ACR3 family arsenite efflux pump ArsB n=1 Tax=Nesterenkonia xinjiangensis TaxID=225327 RepID=A0A7Z0K928_9MICC|nr:arsenic resistance protein [Nesterenkonia xinjiangensis]NYJ78304.1 ACR3 family arsenite efflux pump ArsB [Nesterenkonia xinjiangensis]
MTRAERFQGLLVAGAALLGLALGTVTEFGHLGEQVVLPALLVMLTAVFSQIDLGHVGEVRRARSTVAASLVLNYLFTPALAWGLGAGLLGDQPDLRIGLLLLLVTPCTDWYLVFTAMARGHTGIAVALLPVNLILQVLLLPVYVLLLGGDAAAVEPAALVGAVLIVLVIPLTLGCGLRWGAERSRGRRWREEHLDVWASRLQIPLLCLAVLAMFAWQADTITHSGAELLLLLPPLAIWFVLLPLLATGVGLALRLPGGQRVTLTMVTVARNSPLALGIAVGAFPDRPLIALALVIGALIELPLLAVLAQIVRQRSDR